MMAGKIQLSIVIPAHNEHSNLPFLLEDLVNLRAKLPEAEIIVVDDNSQDTTLKIATAFSRKHDFIRAIHRGKGDNGMGAALKEGTKAAKGKYVVWLMGDRSDNLSALPQFVKKLESGFDMVFGSRHMKGGSRGDLAVSKAILSHGYTLCTRILFGIRVHDITNAFRAFRKELFDRIALESDNFAISPEFAIKAQLARYKLCEVPTGYRDRQSGVSKFKLVRMGVDYVSLFKYRITGYKAGKGKIRVR